MVPDISGRRALTAILLALLTVFVAAPANAAPGEDDEGGDAALHTALDTANRAYLDAQNTLEFSRQRQAELVSQLTETDKLLAELTGTAKALAAAAYRNSGLRTASALLQSVSPDNFMDRAQAVNNMATRSDRQLREYARLRKERADAKAALDAEVAVQEAQLAEMAKRKAQAEKALNNSKATAGFSSTGARTAAPAPRNGNGSFPSQGCTVNDPTTSGCITGRLLHALQQAKAAGFTRYVSCYRGGGSGEHPKGRACDFAAQTGGFGGVATGGDRTYGNNLAAYFVRNAGSLGVLYVIWFRQIWQASTGWRAYNRHGAPNVEHTNHVHLSVY